MRAYLLVGLRVDLAILCLSSLLLAQRSDGGIITGLVTDQTGSSVSGAMVKVRNEGCPDDRGSLRHGAGVQSSLTDQL